MIPIDTAQDGLYRPYRRIASLSCSREVLWRCLYKSDGALLDATRNRVKSLTSNDNRSLSISVPWISIPAESLNETRFRTMTVENLETSLQENGEGSGERSVKWHVKKNFQTCVRDKCPYCDRVPSRQAALDGRLCSFSSKGDSCDDIPHDII